MFQTKALVGPNKACKVIIDGGSCRNLASKELCAKLNLTYLPHPKPYYIQWLSNNGEMKVNHMVRVNFQIGPYKDSIDFDVVPMTVCHLLLGRPWLYDSCRNLASKELCAKLNLTYLPHPKPYYIQWLSNNGEMKVNHMVRVNFQIGPYKDSIDFDVVPMTVCHLLLGRPWLYDRHVQHNGRANTYHLEFKGKKITMQPMTPQEIVNDSRQKIEVNLKEDTTTRRDCVWR